MKLLLITLRGYYSFLRYLPIMFYRMTIIVVKLFFSNYCFLSSYRKAQFQKLVIKQRVKVID